MMSDDTTRTNSSDPGTHSFVPISETASFTGDHPPTEVFPDVPGFEQLQQNPPLDDSDFNATPAVAGKQLFLRSNKFLYCLEAR